MAFPSGWSGYDTITPVNPGSGLTDFTFIVNLGALSATFWSSVKSDGGDIIVSDASNTQVPLDVISFTAGSPGSGIIAFKSSPASSGSQPLRIWAGNSGASQPAANATYGQYNAYPSTRKAFYWNGGGNDRTSYLNHLTMTGSPTVGGAAGAFNSSLATDYNGSTQYGLATASIPVIPMTMLASGRPSNATVDTSPVSVAQTSAASRLLIQYSGAQVGDPIRARSTNATSTTAEASSATGYSANVYSRAVAVFGSTTSRFAGIDGTLGTQDTTSNVPVSMDNIGIGCTFRNGSLGLPFAGRIAFAEVHTVALSTAWISYDKLMHLPANASQSDFYTFGGWTSNGNRRRRALIIGGN